jgi:hypothetical protein
LWDQRRRAIDGEPHEQRALGHDERRSATLELVTRFTGAPGQSGAIEERQRELAEDHTRWAQGHSGMLATMTDDDGLDRLSSHELYDLAVSRAKRHLDVRFFWELMRVLPVAEAAAGELEEAEADVMKLSAHLDDLTDAGRGQIADNLRPFYLEYLRRHGVSAGSGASG